VRTWAGCQRDEDKAIVDLNWDHEKVAAAEELFGEALVRLGLERRREKEECDDAEPPRKVRVLDKADCAALTRHDAVAE
jgi:hypothetical protein